MNAVARDRSGRVGAKFDGNSGCRTGGARYGGATRSPRNNWRAAATARPRLSIQNDIVAQAKAGAITITRIPSPQLRNAKMGAAPRPLSIRSPGHARRQRAFF